MNETTPENAACATCGQPLHGPYCSHCGEKKLDKHDRRIVHLFEEFIHSLTHADSKFLRSLKYLLTKPGFLTSEYLAGRRKLYSTPLSLFFIANLIYLFWTPYDTFNSLYVTQTGGQPYSEYLIPQTQHKMVQKHWTEEQLEEHYNEKSSHEAKLLLILFVFLLSLPVTLLFFSRERYYFDYFVFAIEYVNFIMYGLMLLLPGLVELTVRVVQLMGMAGTKVYLNAYIFYGIPLVLLWTYLTIASSRVFNQPWWQAIIKAVVLTFCTILAMFLYRYLAFEVTMFLL